MDTDDTTRGIDPSIRAVYEEYDVGSVRVALIADPANEHAWLQSDVTRPIEP